ncbi:unnamed protein product, partial [Scytosiphon promiscuus]
SHFCSIGDHRTWTMARWACALLSIGIISDTLMRAGLVSGFQPGALPGTGLLRAPRPSRAVTGPPRQRGRQLRSSTSPSTLPPPGDRTPCDGHGRVWGTGTALRPPGAAWRAVATQRRRVRGRG